MKKYYYLLHIAMIFIMPLKIFSADDIKIAYVNLEALLQNSTQFSQIQETLKEEFTPKQEELVQGANLLREQVESFNINKATMTEAEVQQKIAELQKIETELKNKREQLDTALKTRNNELLAKLQRRINIAIEKIISEKKYDLILYQQVAFASERINITSLVNEYLKEVE